MRVELTVCEAGVDAATYVHRLCYLTVGIPEARAGEEYLRFLEAECGWGVLLRNREGEPVGLATGALLHPAFGRHLENARHPFVHNHIRRRIKFNEPTFLRHADRGRLNARGGSTFFIGHFGLGRATGAMRQRVGKALFRGLVDHSAGDRISRIWIEAVGRQNVEDLLSLGYEPRPHYGDGGHQASLLELTYERAVEMQNEDAARLLRYQPPMLSIPPALQQYVELVQRGLRRPQIAERLGVTPAAVDRRRTRIIEHFRHAAPHVLQSGSADGRLAPILQYLRANPSELRPYDP